MSYFTNRATKQRQQGAVLILALGMTMLMAWLALAVLDSIREELALKASPASKAQLRQTAYQLLELSIGVLAEIKQFEGELYTPSQGWGYPLPYAGISDSKSLQTAIRERSGTEGATERTKQGEDSFEISEADIQSPLETVGANELLDGLLEDSSTGASGQDGFSRKITIIRPEDNQTTLGAELASLQLPPGIEAQVRLYDESGKLSLTATKVPRWILFFKEMDFEESESKELTDSLLDWIDTDNDERENGAESETYRQLEPPYVAPNRPIRDFEELRYVQGFKKYFFDEAGIANDHLKTFRQNVSLYHTDEVNLNTASELVIRTIAEEQSFDPDNVLDFLAGSDLTFGSDDDRVLRPDLEESDLPKNEQGEPLKLLRPVRFISAEIKVSAGQSIYHLNAILDLAQKHPGGIYPFRILKIIENQPIV